MNSPSVICRVNGSLFCQCVMCTAIRTTGFTTFLDGQIYTRVCVPEFLIRLGAGQRQIDAAHFDLCLRIRVCQAFIPGVGAMGQGFISTKKESVFYPNISSQNVCAMLAGEAVPAPAPASTSAAYKRA